MCKHAGTWPVGRRLCFDRHPLVFLSHWHYDHIAAITRLPATNALNALSQTWIVPTQYIGLNALKIAVLVNFLGKLLIWPPAPFGPASLITSNILVERCSGALSDRNNSGLAITILDTKENAAILLPGDARYENIPATGQSFKWVGLVATHHGGSCGSVIPLPASGFSRIAYSYGLPNIYGHPSSVALHTAAGWVNAFHTAALGLPPPNRGSIYIGFAPPAATPISPACALSGVPMCNMTIDA